MTTPEELRILRHALGIDRGNVPYRNRYVATMASEAHEICIGLTRRGLMSCYEASPSFVCYHVTDAGIAAAQAGDAPKPKQCTWTEDEDGVWRACTGISRFVTYNPTDAPSHSTLLMNSSGNCGKVWVVSQFEM